LLIAEVKLGQTDIGSDWLANVIVHKITTFCLPANDSMDILECDSYEINSSA